MNGGEAELLSVVIPTRDKAPRLRLTLACLAGEADDRTEVLVVDDGSTDTTADVLLEAAEHLTLRVLAGGGLGRAGARNLGAAYARGTQLVFLDDDVLVGPGFVAAHRHRCEPDRFVHGQLRELPAADHLVRTLDGAPYPAVRAARDLIHSGQSAHPRHRLRANALERAVEAMHGGELPDAVPWLGCVGANVSMPRDLWARVGGFDAGFGEVWGCEDLELGLRLHQAGARRDVVPAALGVHLTHRRARRWDEHAVNMDRFATLHPLPAVRELPFLLSAAGDPAVYVGRVLAGGAAPS
ncbi:glycosyltransferase family 2 protein [Actinophytocola sp.]|uniref:glycosyltransferase family 2 protein n=1 Tax=Actinophytocola sp. TaxID=1872138 RepID=UPI002ED2E9AA